MVSEVLNGTEYQEEFNAPFKVPNLLPGSNGLVDRPWMMNYTLRCISPSELGSVLSE